jgi:hypothetical protein
VVDVGAPLLNRADRNGDLSQGDSVGEGGYLFIQDCVLKCGYPPPPILLISRLGAFRTLSWRGSKVAEIAVANFTPRSLDRVFRDFGIPSHLDWEPLFGEDIIDPRREPDSNARVKLVRTKLENLYLGIYSAKEQESFSNRAWSIVRRTDETLRNAGIRNRVFAANNENIVLCINELYQRLQRAIELERVPKQLAKSQRQDSWRRSAWFHMLQAELLWALKPVEALYFLMNAIELNLKAGVEPLGVPGDPAYNVALRISYDHRKFFSVRKWFFSVEKEFTGARKLRFRIRKTSRAVRDRLLRTVKRYFPKLAWSATRKIFAPHYSEHVWHRLLRLQVSAATRKLGRGHPEAFFHIETRLRELSLKLQKKGYERAAHELEARSFQAREGRLSPLEKWLHRVLRLLCDYGNRPVRLFGWCVVTVVVFAVLYMPMPDCLVRHSVEVFSVQIPPPIHFKEWPYVQANGVKGWSINFVTAVYFSVVTFVTLGYGDITPLNSFGKIVAAFEAICGFTMFGLSIAVLSARLRPR